MFSLIPVINFPDQQSIPLAVPFSQQTKFPASQNASGENVIKDVVFKPDDTPFFSDVPKYGNESHVPQSGNINKSTNQYKPYGSYQPCYQNKTPYPLYGWSFPSSYQELQSQNQKHKKIVIEDVEEFENEMLAEMENLEMEPNEEKLFELKFNVQGFALKDVKVQHHEDQLLIEGKQKAKTSVGTFFRTFSYFINLPEDIETHSLITYLNNDGILYIKSKSPKQLNSRE